MTGALLLALSLSLPIPAHRGQAALVERSAGTLVAAGGGSPAAYPIGSTIKPLTLLAAYRAGLLTGKTRITCQGRSGRFRCSHPPLGALSATQALEHSCNWFVLTAGRRIPPALFRATLAGMGLQTAAAASLSDEDLLGLTTAATPEQLARAYQRWLAAAPPDFLLRGIERGKTGTAERHAWFACFTPRYVLAVVVYNGTGAGHAAPEGRRLLKLIESVYRVRYRDRTVHLDEDRFVGMALAGEAGESRASEYLRALAVLFRTFARRERGRHEAEGFDFCSATHCLALRPGTRAFEAAVRESKNRLLAHAGRAARVFFGANCGGVTEAAETVWPAAKATYLVSQADAYCLPEKWERRFVVRDFSGVLRSGQVHEVRVASRTPSGRALELEINGSSGIAARDLRFHLGRSLGWSALKSTWFDIERRGTELLFRGRGAGHGVGLCQTGAAEMARRGFPYRDILAYYFPGTGVSIDWEALAQELSFDGRTPEVVEHPNAGSFIRATGRPGWAAAATRRGRIHLQPSAALEKAGILESTLKHELLHAAVTRTAPRWLEEGAAIHFAGEGRHYTERAELPEAELERRIAAPSSREEMRQAYAAAYWRVRDMLARQGEDALRKALGLPLARKR